MDNTEIFSAEFMNKVKNNYSRDQFRIGAKVAFLDNQKKERYLEIKKLNQRTATIIVGGHEQWRVAYSLLSAVIEGEDKKLNKSLTEKN